MTNSIHYQLALEDLLADLHFARKHDEIGRLALLAYCEVKAWARRAGKPEVADAALRLFSENPCVNKQAFLAGIDGLIANLEMHELQYQRASPSHAAIGTAERTASAYR